MEELWAELCPDLHGDNACCWRPDFTARSNWLSLSHLSLNTKTWQITECDCFSFSLTSSSSAFHKTHFCLRLCLHFCAKKTPGISRWLLTAVLLGAPGQVWGSSLCQQNRQLVQPNNSSTFPAFEHEHEQKRQMLFSNPKSKKKKKKDGVQNVNNNRFQCFVELRNTILFTTEQSLKCLKWENVSL